MDTEDYTVMVNMKRDYQDFLGINRSGAKRKFGDRLDQTESPETRRSKVSVRDVVESERSVELITARAQVTKLEAQLSQAQLQRQAAQIQHDKQLQDLQLQQQKSQDKVVELSRQVAKLSGREEEYKRKLAEHKASAESSHSGTERKLLALQKEKYQLQTQLTEVTQNSRSSLRELKSAQLRQNTELQICQDQLTDTQEQLEIANKQIKAFKEQVLELEQYQHKAGSDAQKIKDLEKQLAREKEAQILTAAMRSQLPRVSQLQAENRRLTDDLNYCKETEESVLLLREQVRSLTSKASQVDQLNQRCAELQLANRELEKQMKETSCLPDELNMSASEIRGHVAELQKNSALFLQQQASLRANASSQAELITSLKENIASLESSIDKLKEANQVLEMRMERHNIQGDYDPTKTKVLHFSMNPVEAAQRKRAKQLQTLSEENARLKKRVAILEEEGAKASDVTMRVEEKLQEPDNSKQLQEAKQQLASAELKNKRLLEVFKKTSQDFREVVYQLLGYRIDKTAVQDQYKLMSIYAESPSDFFLFQQSSQGEMQLLETSISRFYADMIKTYLHNANSMPGFLASVTMDLLKKQTMIS